jgi:integrase
MVVLRDNLRDKMPRQPTYFEQQGDSFLFTKRLNPKQGRFPLFQDRIKRKMAATNLMEAHQEALKYASALDHLQTVALKDAKGLPVAIKDMRAAAATWLWVVDVDLDTYQALKHSRTRQGNEAREAIEFVRDEVIAELGTHEESQSDPRLVVSYISHFGDYLLGVLNDGLGNNMFSECLETYLKGTNRAHLSKATKAVHDAKRYLELFTETVGDRPVDQIKRRDVDTYIQKRLTNVKTTSVEREINSLRAIWAQSARSLDILTQNPFSHPAIKGLGADAEIRQTPTLDQTRALTKLLISHKDKISSYVQPLVAVLELTGARLSEVWGITKNDWDREANVLYLRPNERRRTLKTKNSVRPFPVTPALATWLDELLRFTPALTTNSASAATLKWLKSQGFDFGNHSLRHGFKQRLSELDAPKNFIEELQGWSSQSMADHYGHVTITERKLELVSRVHAHIGFAESRDNVIPFRAKNRD